MERMTLSVAEVQKALGIGKSAVYALINREGFPKIRMGRKFIIPREAFLRWLDQQTSTEAN